LPGGIFNGNSYTDFSEILGMNFLGGWFHGENFPRGGKSSVQEKLNTGGDFLA